MCNFFKPERGPRPDGQIIVGLAMAFAFIGLVAGTIKLALSNTGLGPYLVSLLEVAG